MARSRRQIPLFEVLRSEDAQVGTPPKPVVPVNGTPAKAPEPPASAPEAPSAPASAPTAPAAPEAPESPRVVVSPEVTPVAPPARERSSAPEAPAPVAIGSTQGRVYQVSATWAYLGIALLIVLLSITWVVGYSRGNTEGNRRAAEAAGPKTLEYQGEGAMSETPVGSGNGNAVVTPTSPVDPGPRLVDPPAAPLEWDGLTDPRKPGVNYYAIVRMRWNDAEAAAAFLSEQGVPAAAVPVKSTVDLASVRANNGFCFVIAMEGFSSDSFRASKAERDALVGRIKDAGRLWKDQGGTDDFSNGGLWARYDG